MKPIIGPAEALLLAYATAKVRDQSVKYDLVQLRLRRDAHHSFAIATDCKFLVLARWNGGGEECDFGVDGESIRQLLRATEEDTDPDEDGPCGLRSRVGGFRASANSVTLLGHDFARELLTVSTAGDRQAGRFPDTNKHIGWLFNPSSPPASRPQPTLCPILLFKIFSVFNQIANGFADRPQVRHFIHDVGDAYSGRLSHASVGCWEMTFKTRPDDLTIWGMLMPLVG